jgi:hypothetical protein
MFFTARHRDSSAYCRRPTYGTTRLLVVKGAPEDLIQLSVEYQQADGRCRPLDDRERHNLLQMFERFG